MKKIFYLSIVLLLSPVLNIAQQILTVQGGIGQNIFSTRSIDDEYSNFNLEFLSGYQGGFELKYSNKTNLSSVVTLDYSFSGYHLDSEWDLEYNYGYADIDFFFNQGHLGYMLEYSVGRRAEFFVAGGATLGWMVYNKMDGEIVIYTEPNGTVSEDKWEKSGKANSQMSRGVLGLIFRTGFVVPVNRKTSIKISTGIRADLNNNAEEKFSIAINHGLDQLIYLNGSIGITYDLGDVLKIEE